jgi:type II secretory pathway pseudopilin PulG
MPRPFVQTLRCHSPLLRARSRRHASGGFSLLELMIVVAIIIILVSLTLAVITPVLLKNEERVTRGVLSQLDAAITEWETSVQRRVTFPNSAAESSAAGTVWDVIFDPPLPATAAAPFTGTYAIQFRRTARLLELVSQEPKAREIISKIPSANLTNIRRATAAANGDQYMDAKGVVDAWGTPIVAVFPGRDWKSTDPATIIKDFDGTIRCVAEDGTTPATTGWGVCRNRVVMFVSAGPDQLFLGVNAADNLYSYGQEGN